MGAPVKDNVTYDDWDKLDIRVGTIERVDDVEGSKKLVALTVDFGDFKRTILSSDVRPHIERIWVNQNIIFSTEELKALKEIGYKYIPRDFFGQELREAAE